MHEAKPVVLLVDDNDATCTLITAILRPWYTIDVAADGAEAMEKLRTGNYAVVLLDLRMPLRDGYDVLDYLRVERPALIKRVLLVTAALTDAELRRAREYPICGIVRKPFEVDQLLSAVHSCAGAGDGRFGDVLRSSPAMLLLVADLLGRRLL